MTSTTALIGRRPARRSDPFVQLRLSVETYVVTDTGMAVRRRTLSYKPAVTGGR